ncbi:mitochondrial thiamine pyrophosphate carrier-like [Danaus plexippus]|uniref:mitochondrial thiamine pyrophosphate carrier-like n=1 Tax=Danaus plexippus TaxID=13037 RepID=UPI002AB00DEA|nr:mitochondrial thiamine pyrophosphate carrier-like [Danaus plexippus]
MVGYRHDDNLTPNQKLIAGCISGVVTRFLTQPLDVLKVRTQLQGKISRKKRLSVFATFKKILYEESILAFWHGHNLGQMHSVLSTSSQFYVYEVTTKYVFSSTVNSEYKTLLEFMCGICAGCCSATLVAPIEVIRVRQMLIQEQYRGFINGAKAVYNSGGVLAFYEGWTAGVLMLGPQVGITFSVFSFMQPLLLNYMYDCNGDCLHKKGNAHTAQDLLLATTIAGGMSGFVSKVMCYPLDLAKRRLQIASHRENAKFYTPTTSRDLVKCTKLVQCVRDTVRREGFLGLYRGLSVTIYKAQITNILTFTTYEFVCYLIR